jgi:Zn-dependent peptidase ImmA (M78 family)
MRRIENEPAKKSGEDSYEYFDRRDVMASTGTNEEEIYANGFAAALLMPESELTPWVGKSSVPQLAVRFGVSAEAMKWRLVNLGLPL